MRRLLLTLLLTMAASAQAFAHTALSASLPADTAAVAAPPEIVLEFTADVRLTSLSLQTAAGEKKSLGALPAAAARKFTVPIAETLPAGEYVVAYRTVGADTHVVAGEIRFTVTET
jgi:hypothetical protein